METSAFLVCSRCHQPVSSIRATACARCGAVFAAPAPEVERQLPARSPVGGIITPQ